MLSATHLIDPPFEIDDTVTLDSIERHRRRIRIMSDGGEGFLLNLENAVRLRHGQGLVLSDGRIVEVRASPELLYEVKGQSLVHLISLAWQLGNRHQAAEIAADHIKIRRDEIIADMIRGLGGSVEPIQAPFDPQGGAYEAKDHGHTHD